MRRTLIFLVLFISAAYCDAIELMPADSPWKLDIYGVILTNTYWNSEAVSGTDVPLIVVGDLDPRAGDEEFSISARQTRFGFRLQAPDLGAAKVSALLEADFFGGFPASGQAPSFSNPRMRLAWMKLDWGKTSFTAGQDWIILAPLNPTTLSHFAVVGLAASGNLWLRYPLLKVDHNHAMGAGKLHLTGGIIRPVSGFEQPFGGTLTDIAGAGERSGMPFWQGRVGYSRSVATDKTLSFGISGHYGKEDYRPPFVQKEIDSWAVAGDFFVPLGNFVSVQGEIFTGSNLDSFQGGVNQGFQGIQTVPTDIESLDTTGGWLQLSLTPPQNKNLSFHVAYGVDDPEELAGNTTLSRFRNATWMSSVFYRFSKHVQTALEYNHITTEYPRSGENSANVINFAIGFWF